MPKKALKKELIQKEDGRYLYLYSWAAGKPVEVEREPGKIRIKKIIINLFKDR
jgi:hypothetical protein